MTPQDPLPSLAQVFVRNSSTSLEEQLTAIRHSSPQILIGTPQALLDAVQEDPEALPLSKLSTVVVDEVDYLVKTVPILKDKIAMQKIERKVNRHPGPTRLLLDHIYSGANQGPYREQKASAARPQLVLMSATLRNHLRRFLLTDSGWFNTESGKLVRITGEVSPHNPRKEQATTSEVEDSAAETVGGLNVQHHVIVVSEDGDIANIVGAVDAPAVSSEESQAETSSDTPLELPPLLESSQAPDIDQAIGRLPFIPTRCFLV